MRVCVRAAVCTHAHAHNDSHDCGSGPLNRISEEFLHLVIALEKKSRGWHRLVLTLNAIIFITGCELLSSFTCCIPRVQDYAPVYNNISMSIIINGDMHCFTLLTYFVNCFVPFYLSIINTY